MSVKVVRACAWHIQFCVCVHRWQLLAVSPLGKMSIGGSSACIQTLATLLTNLARMEIGHCT